MLQGPEDAGLQRNHSQKKMFSHSWGSFGHLFEDFQGIDSIGDRILEAMLPVEAPSDLAKAV